jgi:hypothetical protein
MYLDCNRDRAQGGGLLCDRNVECVETPGKTKWCTGPKIDECYLYEPFIYKVFQRVVKVNSFVLKVQLFGSAPLGSAPLGSAPLGSAPLRKCSA